MANKAKMIEEVTSSGRVKWGKVKKGAKRAGSGRERQNTDEQKRNQMPRNGIDLGNITWMLFIVLSL
ncbi:hypothetical protein AKJ16_DCAP22288 [Drosera capensis]